MICARAFVGGSSGAYSPRCCVRSQPMPLFSAVSSGSTGGWTKLYDMNCVSSSRLDAPTALAACCEVDLCYKYIWYMVFGIFFLFEKSNM